MTFHVNCPSANWYTFCCMQKLEADSEDSYLNAEWADPDRLKRQITGTGSISWRPK